MTEPQFETILRQALHPEVLPQETVLRSGKQKKGTVMKTKNMLKKIVLVAAVVMLLATTVYAADFLDIRSLATTGWHGFASESYQDMNKAMKMAGFRPTVVEEFEKGYAFKTVIVGETGAYDEHSEELFAYKELNVNYRNPEGKMLHLFAHEIQEALPQVDRAPAQVCMAGDVQVRYQRDHYKFVPEDYQLTAEDEAMLEQPGYYLSYGSDTVIEQDNQSLTWEKDGISYHLLDSGAQETPETLLAMAEELILTGDQED